MNNDTIGKILENNYKKILNNSNFCRNFKIVTAYKNHKNLHKYLVHSEYQFNHTTVEVEMLTIYFRQCICCRAQIECTLYKRSLIFYKCNVSRVKHSGSLSFWVIFWVLMLVMYVASERAEWWKRTRIINCLACDQCSLEICTKNVQETMSN